MLSRHESLAANLGAKPTAPRLLRAMEGMFEGPIAVSPISPQSPFNQDPRVPTWYTPSWLDIVAFAKSNPGEFHLTSTPGGGPRVCRFYLKNVKVEISEDDWRLIMSGTLDRFHLVATQPLEEDETAELATLEILEQRLQTLIKKADEVARKARQLNYHLSGRKAGINTRLAGSHHHHLQSAVQAGGPSSMTVANQPHRAGGVYSPGYDLHADLLQQFQAPSTRPASRSRGQNAPPTPSDPSRHRATPSGSQPHLFTHSNRPSPFHGPESPAQRDTPIDDPSAVYKSLIQTRIDALVRGDVITPPCDRCRRRKMQCIKHLTACQGCTKKHAKCGWKNVTEEEMSSLRRDISPVASGEERQDVTTGSYPATEAAATATATTANNNNNNTSGDADPNRHEGVHHHASTGANHTGGAALGYLINTEPGGGSRIDSQDTDMDRAQDRLMGSDGRGAPTGATFSPSSPSTARVGHVAATAAGGAPYDHSAISRGSSAG